MATSLTDLLKQLILGAIGDPDSANELIAAVESGGGGGVGSINSLTGALNIVAGTNVTITPSGGNTLTIDSSGGGGILPNDAFYQIRNAANTADYDIFKLDTNDTLIFQTSIVPFGGGEIDLGTQTEFFNNVWSSQISFVDNNDPSKRITVYADPITTSYNMVLPSDIGTAGQVLTIDSVTGGDTAVLSWAAGGGGTPTGDPNTLTYFDASGNLSSSTIVFGVPVSWPNIVGNGQAIGLIGTNAFLSTSGGATSFLGYGSIDTPYSDGTKIVFNSGYLPSPLAFGTTYYLYQVTISVPSLSAELAKYDVCSAADPATFINWPVGPPGSGTNTGTTYATISDDASIEVGKLFINDDSLANATNGDVWTLQDQTTGEGSWAPSSAGFEILAFTSDPGPSGVAGSPIFDVSFVVTGLLATDTILSVTQKNPGAAGTLALLGWHTQANDAIVGEYVADPGVGAIIVVAVKR